MFDILRKFGLLLFIALSYPVSAAISISYMSRVLARQGRKEPTRNYGRDCGTLKSSGRDVGAILMEEGLAVPFVCGATRCPKTPRPWC